VKEATANASVAARIAAGTSRRPTVLSLPARVLGHNLLDLRDDGCAVDLVEIKRFAEGMATAAAKVDTKRREHAHGVWVKLDEIANQGVGDGSLSNW
jgi:hypothetical protein